MITMHSHAAGTQKTPGRRSRVAAFVSGSKYVWFGDKGKKGPLSESVEAFQVAWLTNLGQWDPPCWKMTS